MRGGQVGRKYSTVRFGFKTTPANLGPDGKGGKGGQGGARQGEGAAAVASPARSAPAPRTS